MSDIKNLFYKLYAPIDDFIFSIWMNYKQSLVKKENEKRVELQNLLESWEREYNKMFPDLYDKENK